MNSASLSVSTASPDSNYPPAIQVGILTLYRFYDIGDEINLERAQDCLAAPSARRYPPARVRQSESLDIAQPPVGVDLGTMAIDLAQVALEGNLRASVYDLGAVVLALEMPLPSPTEWLMVARFFAAIQMLPEALEQRFLTVLEDLEAVIRPAVIKPARSPIVEDYSMLLVEQLAGDCSIAALAEHPLVQAALLGEDRPLSRGATDLITAMSYFPDDLAMLSWNGALFIEADPLAAATASDLIEFANVELLFMRTYDNELDAQLPQMYRRIAAPQRRFTFPIVKPYNQLLRDVLRLVADVTEVTERVDNAFKVTDDVYWNRLYSALLNVLRVHVWRRGVEHRLELLRETYSILHNEADAERAAALEWAIVLLILFEIILIMFEFVVALGGH